MGVLFVKTKISDSGYNKIYRHHWRTNLWGLPSTWIDHIDSVVTGLWGWHFTPHKNMDYRREKWYEDQTLVITFENYADLIQVKLSVKN